MNWHGDSDELIASLQRWREAGASHVSVNTMGAGLVTVDDHLAVLARDAGRDLMLLPALAGNDLGGFGGAPESRRWQEGGLIDRDPRGADLRARHRPEMGFNACVNAVIDNGK